MCTFKRTKVFQIYHKKLYFINFEYYMLKLSKSWTKCFTHKVRQRGFSIQKLFKKTTFSVLGFPQKHLSISWLLKRTMGRAFGPSQREREACNRCSSTAQSNIDIHCFFLITKWEKNKHEPFPKCLHPKFTQYNSKLQTNSKSLHYRHIRS